MLGGTVEAAACEPEAAIALGSASFDAHENEDQPSGQPERHGLCVHGHCHHGSQAITDHARLPAFEIPADVPISVSPKPLQPLLTDTPKRPPRA